MTRHEYQMRMDNKGKPIDKKDLTRKLDMRAMGERIQSRLIFTQKHNADLDIDEHERLALESNLNSKKKEKLDLTPGTFLEIKSKVDMSQYK